MTTACAASAGRHRRAPGLNPQASPARCRRKAPRRAPTAGRWCCPRCRRMNSRKSVRRNCRRTCAGRKWPIATKEPAGTLIVDTPNTYLYYVLGGGRAIRYGVRVGRDGFTWTGVQKISRKAEWPDWHPPTEMIERQPYLPRFMAGGPGNPLGARAMYLGSTVLSHPRHQPALDHRQVRLLGLHRHAERGRLGPVRSRQGRHPRGRAARRRAAAVNRDRLGAAAAARRRRPPGVNVRCPARSPPWCRRCPRR